MIIAGILKQKGADVLSVSPDASVTDIIGVLAEHRIGAVLVVGSGRTLVGIVSERDIVRSLAEHGARTLDMTASELMTSDVTTATPDTTVDGALEIMTDGRFRHMPVLSGKQLIGLISIGDVVKAKIGEAEHEVHSLRAYVAGEA